MKKIIGRKTAARKEIIDFIIKKYISLDLSLDACQGCCEDLDEKFGVLRYYKKIARYLGGMNEEEFRKVVHDKHSEVWDEEMKEYEERQRRNKCKYCNPYKRPELMAGEYKNMNMFVDTDEHILDITCHVGWEYDKDLREHLEITEDDTFAINYCPICGRKLGDENEEE